MKALLYLGPEQWESDSEGQIQAVVTTDMLSRGNTLPGRFLLEVGDELANQFTVTWNAAPSAPQNLTATTASDASIAVSWTAPATPNGSVTYSIYRAITSSGPWITVATGWTSIPDPVGHPLVFGLRDTLLTPSTAYYYKVTAVNANGEGAAAGPVSATTFAPPASPVTPSWITGYWSLIATSWYIDLSWDVSQRHSGETYNIYGSSDGVAYTKIDNESDSPATYVEGASYNGFHPSTLVDVYLYVTCLSADTLTESAPSSVVELLGRQAPVLNSVIQDFTNNWLVVSWTAPVGVGTVPSYYIVYRATSSAGPWIEVTTPGLCSASPFNDNLVTFGVTYYYSVVAYYNNESLSNASNIVSALYVELPTIPTGLTATAGNQQVTVTWLASTGTFTPINYNLERMVGSGGTYAVIQTKLTSLFFVDTALTNGVTYYYKVAAVDAQSNVSDWSSPANATPVAGGSPPTITVQPVSNAVVVGSSVTLSVTATGGTLYQWYSCSTYHGTFEPVSGATNATLVFDNLQVVNGAYFSVQVSNEYGTVASIPVILFVMDLPVLILTNLDSFVVAFNWTAPDYAPSDAGNGGVDYVLSLTVNDGSPETSLYAWETNTTTQTFTANDVIVAYVQGTVDVNSFTDISTTSDSVSITVPPSSDSPPTINTQPISQTVVEGQPVTFTVVATGSGTLTYQWTRNNVDISGATATAYTISSVALSDAAGYAVKVTNSGGTTTSATANLTVNLAPPTITTQPTTTSPLIEGDPCTLTVVATGSGTLTYQWQVDFGLGGGWINFPSATSAALVLGPVFTFDTGSYRVIVTNGGGSVTSTTVSLVVYGIFNYAAGGTWDTYDPYPNTSSATITYYPNLNLLTTWNQDVFGGNTQAAVGFHFFYTGPAWVLQVQLSALSKLPFGPDSVVVLSANGTNVFHWYNGTVGNYNVTFLASSAKVRVDLLVQTSSEIQNNGLIGTITAAFYMLSHPILSSS